MEAASTAARAATRFRFPWWESVRAWVGKYGLIVVLLALPVRYVIGDLITKGSLVSLGNVFVSGISKPALSALISYDWPGNVRELENAVERAVIIAAGRQIELEDLPGAIGNVLSEREAMVRTERAQAANEGRSAKLEIEVPSSMDEIERHAIQATLDYTSGDKTRAAKLLNIGRKTIYRKLDQYNGKSSPSKEQ